MTRELRPQSSIRNPHRGTSKPKASNPRLSFRSLSLLRNLECRYPPLTTSLSNRAIRFWGISTAEVGGDKPEIIFIGTRTSEGIPRASCLTNPLKTCEVPTCEVCFKATEPDNKNRRLNTSILIRYPSSSDGLQNILVDAGKFFYHSALRSFPAYGYNSKHMHWRRTKLGF